MGQFVHQRFPASREEEITPGADRMAHSRTEHLHRHVPNRPISDLLAWAYLQGVNDTAQALEKQGWNPPDEPKDQPSG